MSFFSRLRKPRDATVVTTAAMPDIRDDIRSSGTLFVFGKSDAGERVDERTSMQIATVYACVRLLSESVAQLPLHLYRYTDNESSKEKVRDHPLYRILNRSPNPEMSRFSFIEVMMTHLLLWGNAYAQIVRDGRNTVLGLYPLLPENVEIDRLDGGDLFYTYHAYTNEKPGENNKDILFRRDEILHIPGLGFNGLVGFSPIAMMKNALGSAIAVEKYGSSFFRNSGTLSGVLEHPGVLKDPAKIRQNFMDTYSGAANAHKVAVLEENMHYKPISLPPEDSQFLSTRVFGVEEICRIFRVPPHLVQDLRRSTFNNIEAQGISYVQYTLMPWLERFEQAIIKDVLTEEEQNEYFPKFNVDGLLRGDYKSRMEGYRTAINCGIITVNEAREKENFPPIPDSEGGNFHFVNGSYILLRDIGSPYGLNRGQQEEPDPPEDPDGPEPEKQEEEPKEDPQENKYHTQRHNKRRAARKGG